MQAIFTKGSSALLTLLKLFEGVFGMAKNNNKPKKIETYRALTRIENNQTGKIWIAGDPIELSDPATIEILINVGAITAIGAAVDEPQPQILPQFDEEWLSGDGLTPQSNVEEEGKGND